MSLWHQVLHGIRGLTHRDAVQRDAADEVEHWLEESAQEHMARPLG